MRFDSDEVRAFKQYAKENLSEKELEESRKLVRSRKSRHSSGLSESQKKDRDKTVTRILLESRRDFEPKPKQLPACASGGAEGRLKVQFPGKLCS